MEHSSVDRPPLERLYAGWRLAHPKGVAGDGVPHREPPPVDGQSLFEAIEQSELADADTYIVDRWERTFSILNVFPYTSGHVMVLPLRAVAGIADLDDDTYDELWRHVRTAAAAVQAAFSPEGLNIGVNEGEAGGGSVPEHLHVHVVPRWNADTNFMTSVADARIVPMTLSDSWTVLREHWPGR